MAPGPELPAVAAEGARCQGTDALVEHHSCAGVSEPFLCFLFLVCVCRNPEAWYDEDQHAGTLRPGAVRSKSVQEGARCCTNS